MILCKVCKGEKILRDGMNNFRSCPVCKGKGSISEVDNENIQSYAKKQLLKG